MTKAAISLCRQGYIGVKRRGTAAPKEPYGRTDGARRTAHPLVGDVAARACDRDGSKTYVAHLHLEGNQRSEVKCLNVQTVAESTDDALEVAISDAEVSTSRELPGITPGRRPPAGAAA
eukprot:scaffold33165_cov144-Isochrysis_galbana.AAC.3